MEKQELEQQKEQELKLRNKMVEEQKTNKNEMKEEKVVETPKQKSENKESEKKPEEKSKPADEVKKNVEKSEDKKEIKKPAKIKSKVKKTEAIVNLSSLPISTKHSIAVCRFIKGKEIEKAINDLERVVLLKKPVPMKGEIPHRKGMMSGRYPKKTAEHFIKLLKELSANVNVNGLENPIISEAIANIASRPYSRFGRVRKKRTHVKIIARQKPKVLDHSSLKNQTKEKILKEAK